MRALVDITHPADVHLFRHLIRELGERGHDVLVTARQKDVTVELLRDLAIPCHCLSQMGSGVLGMARELAERNLRLLQVCKRSRPDVMVARIGISIGPVGAMLRVPRVVIEDTEHAWLQLSLSLPFATYICTGTGYLKRYGSRHVRFRGVPVLAYLDPRYFRPDPEPLRQAGIDPAGRYIVMRMVSWSAAHDVGLQGARDDTVLRVAERLSQYGRVLISSEAPLPKSLMRYSNPVPIKYMHDLLASALLYVGEGGTTAAEAAALGTPSVFCSPLRTGYLLALNRRYGLVHLTDSLIEGLEVAENLLNRAETHQTWRRQRQRLLDDSEDIVQFMVRLTTYAASRHRRKRTARNR